jgi:ADP-ribosyl-[dinitrogen reductase] hydrolase
MGDFQRIIGCILGGAIGDAFAGPYEGAPAPIAIDYQLEWRLSDDTQLTLATCEAISTSRQVDPAIISSTFVQWYRNSQLTGLGASTYKALSELSVGGHWALVGRKGEMAAGNGAAMRVAPLAFCLDPEEPGGRRMIRDVCRITHHNEEAYSGALAILLAVRAAYLGTWCGHANLLELIIPNLPDSSVRDRLIALDEVRRGISIGDIAAQFGCSGYVVESVPLALLGAQRVNELGFKELMESIARAGGDTDTIASMAGQVCGTVLGQQNLPIEMVRRLPSRERIISLAETFAKTVMNASP